MRNLKDILSSFITQHLDEQELYTVRATVNSVDLERNTAEVTEINTDSIITEVQLQAFNGAQNGLLLIPAEGSTVAVSFFNPDEGFIASSERLQAFKITFDNSTFIMTDEEIVINGGELEGLVKINELTEKLNNLVSEVNALKDIFNAHIHVTTATVGASALVGVISATSTPATPASTFNKGDYENEKIKQ